MPEKFFQIPIPKKETNLSENSGREGRLEYPRREKKKNNMPSLFPENDNSYGYESNNDKLFRPVLDKKPTPSDPDEGHQQATALIGIKKSEEIELAGKETDEENFNQILEQIQDDQDAVSRTNRRY